MNILASLVVFTANILGIFNDPFEFEGDYGPEINPIRQKVFEVVAPKDKNSDYGPVLSELVTLELVLAIADKQKELERAGFSALDLDNILSFLNRHAHQKLFLFVVQNPAQLLSLDKVLRDQGSRSETGFNLPILTSSQPLEGQNSLELKQALLDAVFTEEVLMQTESEDKLKAAVSQLDINFLRRFLGEQATNEELEALCSPAGQIFFYWLYHAFHLHLISEDPAFIQQVNKAKKVFANTIGDSLVRAHTFREKLISTDAAVLITQESDLVLAKALTDDQLFLPVDRQNPQDGCFVFLRADLWEADYEVIPIEEYERYAKGRVVVVLATHKGSGKRFLLASAHGHSTKAEDGRLQISFIVEKYHQLALKPENADLQLLIGTDANTKKDEDVILLREHLNSLGLIATSVGPTTVKQRVISTQYSKIGTFAIDEEDYLITLNPESGGHFLLNHQTLGFEEKKADPRLPLPNIDNQSDHYPVGATLEPL